MTAARSIHPAPTPIELPATRAELRALVDRVAELERRLAELIASRKPGPKPKPLDEVSLAILDYLRRTPGWTVPYVVTANLHLDVDNTAVGNRLMALHRRGLVERMHETGSTALYRITPTDEPEQD